jgi:hypothetical protein
MEVFKGAALHKKARNVYKFSDYFIRGFIFNKKLIIPRFKDSRTIFTLAAVFLRT